jgi:hypothetical protein
MMAVFNNPNFLKQDCMKIVYKEDCQCSKEKHTTVKRGSASKVKGKRGRIQETRGIIVSKIKDHRPKPGEELAVICQCVRGPSTSV